MDRVRVAAAAFALLAPAVLGACDDGGSAGPDGPLTPYVDPGVDDEALRYVDAPDDPGWQVLDAEAEVRSLDESYSGVTALAVDDVGPVLLRAGRDRVTALDSAVVDTLRDPRTVSEYGDYVIAVDADPTSGRPAEVAGGYVGDAAPSLELPRDAAGRSPAWFWADIDENEELQQVGLVPGADAAAPWRLHSWVDRRTPVLASPDSAPWAPAGTSLHADDIEGYVYVAGPLSTDPPPPGTTPPASVWLSPASFVRRSRWQRLPTRPQPDRLTDVGCWALGCWVAGVRDGRVVVHDHDKGGGRALPVPAIPVSDDATVLVAGVPIGGPLALAVESAGVVDLWLRPTRTRTWVRVPAPDGTLSDALVRGGQVYLAVGGRLWYADLGGLRDLAAE